MKVKGLALKEYKIKRSLGQKYRDQNDERPITRSVFMMSKKQNIRCYEKCNVPLRQGTSLSAGTVVACRSDRARIKHLDNKNAI